MFKFVLVVALVVVAELPAQCNGGGAPPQRRGLSVMLDFQVSRQRGFPSGGYFPPVAYSPYGYSPQPYPAAPQYPPQIYYERSWDRLPPPVPYSNGAPVAPYYRPLCPQ